MAEKMLKLAGKSSYDDRAHGVRVDAEGALDLSPVVTDIPYLHSNAAAGFKPTKSNHANRISGLNEEGTAARIRIDSRGLGWTSIVSTRKIRLPKKAVIKLRAYASGSEVRVTFTTNPSGGHGVYNPSLAGFYSTGFPQDGGFDEGHSGNYTNYPELILEPLNSNIVRNYDTDLYMVVAINNGTLDLTSILIEIDEEERWIPSQPLFYADKTPLAPMAKQHVRLFSPEFTHSFGHDSSGVTIELSSDQGFNQIAYETTKKISLTNVDSIVIDASVERTGENIRTREGCFFIHAGDSSIPSPSRVLTSYELRDSEEMWSRLYNNDREAIFIRLPDEEFTIDVSKFSGEYTVGIIAYVSNNGVLADREGGINVHVKSIILKGKGPFLTTTADPMEIPEKMVLVAKNRNGEEVEVTADLDDEGLAVLRTVQSTPLLQSQQQTELFGEMIELLKEIKENTNG